ncbi:MAG: competence protein CoiA family protein [Kiritimatiellia bacterium]
MFQVWDQSRNCKVYCRDEVWSRRPGELREWAREGRLVCHVCRKSTRFRAGDKRRPHFAHLRKSDCPLGKQSPEVLEAKALVFEWLRAKQRKKDGVLIQVDMDEPVPGRGDLRADVLARTHKGFVFAYWFFDRQQRNRERWLQLRSETFRAHFIHLTSTLVLKEPHYIELTASQRDFIACPSRYDPCVGGNEGDHLTFLNPDTGQVSIYRRLFCDHPPALFRWGVLRQTPLANALLCPNTGEIVAEADIQALQEHARKEKERLQREEEQRQRQAEERLRTEERLRAAGAVRQRAEAEWIERRRLHGSRLRAHELLEQPGTETPGFASLAEAGTSALSRQPTPQPADETPLRVNLPYRCKYCGNMTTVWQRLTGLPDECVCRDCFLRNPPTAQG